MIDLIFYGLCLIYIMCVFFVLFRLKSNPLYEPKVLFSIFSLSWMVIIYGYSVDYSGFLAAESIDYIVDIKVLSIISVLLFILGYIAFILGASINFRVTSKETLYDVGLIKYLSYSFIVIAILNFSINVYLISSGNIIVYLFSTAGRSYQIAEGLGVSAVGYMFGHIGVCVLFYICGRFKAISLKVVFVLFFIVLIIKLSQGRIFQVLVFCGSCYFCYLIGRAGVNSAKGFTRQLRGLIIIFSLGLCLYILRIVSAYYYMGGGYDNFSLAEFFGDIVHFAVERGNLPNIPVLLTIIDKVPSSEFFLSGKTIFNWLIYFFPKTLLPDDFLISMWIKSNWYKDIEGGGLPPTGIGEWYANFGPVGVFVGMFTLGVILNHIYRVSKYGNSIFMNVLWANLAFGFIIIYPKTDLAQIPVYTLFFVLVFYVFYVIFRGLLRR